MGTSLGDFVRARRDMTRPEAVGLATGGRRRAPGLRRSELAALAGISVEYLVRIEQGRDHNPSPSVVNALADALCLDVSERDHLTRLAKIAGGVCVGARGHIQLRVRPAVRRVLAQLEPGIALISNRLGDILAHTRGFELIAGPSGLLDDHRPNLTRFVFTDPRARELFPDWDRVADEQAADLWRELPDDRSAEFQAQLAPTAGAELTRRLNRHVAPRSGSWLWRHPAVGELRLDREVLQLPAADAQRMVVLLPADDPTTDMLGRLTRLADESGWQH